VAEKTRTSLSTHAVSQAGILMTALEGAVDFDSLSGVLRKWARQAPQLAPKATPASAPKAAPPATGPRRAAVNPVQNQWRLQVGAFSSIAGAQRQLSRLADSAEGLMEGLQWSLLQTRRPGQKEILFYRLQIGPFADRPTAEAKCNQIKPLGLDCFVVAP